MKVLKLCFCLFCLIICSCGSNSESYQSYNDDYSSDYDCIPETFVETESVSQPCGQCNGNGGWFDYNGDYVQCYVCQGAGVNIVFKSRQAYYAECSHCNCKMFQSERTGSTTCECGHSKFGHVKRYL